jgi:hypothetical protein
MEKPASAWKIHPPNSCFFSRRNGTNSHNPKGLRKR